MIRALYISLGLLVLSATLKADELQEGRQPLLDQGCTQVVFATRGGQIDGHWYANIGYYAFDKNKKLYASGAHLAITNWLDVNCPFHPSYWGRLNATFKTHDNFRPDIAFEDALRRTVPSKISKAEKGP